MDIKKCKYCDKELVNQNNTFCNYSCAKTYNNKNRIYKIKEKPVLSTKKCKHCEKILPFSKKYNTFCDSSCAASYNNKNRIISDETKSKITESLFIYYDNVEGLNGYLNRIKKCKFCDKELTKKQIHRYNSSIFCSSDCQHKNGMSEETKQKIRNTINEKVKNGTHIGWSSRNIESYPEKFFKQVLKNNNIDYEFNKVIIKKNINLDENCNYFLDFYIPLKNIDLEIDGSQHKYRIESDEKRDKYLTEYGIKVYRIKWISINNDKGKEYIKNEIDKFLIFYNSVQNIA